MTDATTPAADEFEMEVSVTIRKNGRAWTRQATESFQMDQTNAVIAQHVIIDAVRDPLFKMGIASATVKDEAFGQKYRDILAVVTAKPAPVIG